MKLIVEQSYETIAIDKIPKYISTKIVRVTRDVQEILHYQCMHEIKTQ